MSNSEEDLSLKEIHDATSKVVEFIHNFCDENGLCYYLAYGTLLGCIRHRGFIPWDDDADIWMLREDYNRMINIFKKNDYVIDNYKLCIRESTSRYTYSIARISDLRYKYVASGIKGPDMGTFVDIYPLDYVNSQETFIKAYKNISILNRKYAIVCNPEKGNAAKVLLKKIVRRVLKLRYKDNYLEVVNRSTKEIIMASGSTESDYLGVLGWFTTGKKVYPKYLFQDRVLKEFEGMMLYVPKEFDLLLSSIYGDYMTPPPQANRVQYHNYKIYRRE